MRGYELPGDAGGLGTTFDYDRYGNGWVSSWNTFSPSAVTPQTQSAYEANTNRMPATVPDEAGNQRAANGSSFTYDAESRMRRSMVNRQTVYQYDGEGRRVMKVDCALDAGTCDSTTPEAKSTWFVYDAQGRLAAEWSNGVSAASPCTTCYLMTDHLGSTRVVTDGTTGAALQCHDYLPFGEEIPAPVGGRAGCYASDPGTGLLFTGKERDGETQNSAMPGLDYFGARYFSGAQGRFTSPDEPLIDQSPEDPQSWNLYSYVRNNPLIFTDPTGEDCVYTSNQTDSSVTVTLERGNCSTKGGTFVNGTVDANSFKYNGSSLDFGYTDPNGAGGVFSKGFAAPPSDALAPGVADMLHQVGVVSDAGVKAAARIMGEQVLMETGVRAVGLGIEALLAARAVRSAVNVSNLSSKILRQMGSRGWTKGEILETVEHGMPYKVLNKATGGGATEYVNPVSGKFVVVDDATKQVLQVSGPGHLPNHLMP